MKLTILRLVICDRAVVAAATADPGCAALHREWNMLVYALTAQQGLFAVRPVEHWAVFSDATTPAAVDVARAAIGDAAVEEALALAAAKPGCVVVVGPTWTVPRGQG